MSLRLKNINKMENLKEEAPIDLPLRTTPSLSIKTRRFVNELYYSPRRNLFFDRNITNCVRKYDFLSSVISIGGLWGSCYLAYKGKKTMGVQENHPNLD